MKFEGTAETCVALILLFATVFFVIFLFHKFAPSDSVYVPKFKAGDCVADKDAVEEHESWSLEVLHIAKIIGVGKNHYHMIWLANSQYNEEVAINFTDLSYVDKNTAKVDCPEGQ